MKTILKLEKLAEFFLGFYLFSLLEYEWWWFLVLLLTPDISILGYLMNSKIGAFLYNLFHHKGFAILIYVTGSYLLIPLCQLIGLVLFSHASMDRFFGYGLKYDMGFKFTHLGEIGK